MLMTKFLLSALLALLILLSFSGCAEKKYPTLNYFVDGEVYHTDVLETEDEIFSGIGKEPMKAGCYFGGWYYDEGTWEKPLSYTELNRVTENKEYRVYAKWETVKLEYVEADRAYTVVGLLLGAGNEVVIPKTYKDMPITKIAAEAFRGNQSLTSITIPDTVTEIGAYAFAECTALKSIALPKSVVSLGKGAFSNCIALQTATLGISLKAIEAETFFRCSLLTEIVIPESAKRIGNSAFAFATSLTKVSLPSRLVSIGHEAFAGCGVTELSYAGKKSDWDSIAKDDFAKNASITTIRCIDGTLDLTEE